MHSGTCNYILLKAKGTKIIIWVWEGMVSLFQKENSTLYISVCIVVVLLTLVLGYIVCARLIHE